MSCSFMDFKQVLGPYRFHLHPIEYNFIIVSLLIATIDRRDSSRWIGSLVHWPYRDTTTIWTSIKNSYNRTSAHASNRRRYVDRCSPQLKKVRGSLQIELLRDLEVRILPRHIYLSVELIHWSDKPALQPETQHGHSRYTILPPI